MYLLHRFLPQVRGMWRTSSFARSFPAWFRISRLISSRFLSAPIHVWTSSNIMQFLGKEAGNVSFLSSVNIWACFRQHVPNTSADIKSIPALVVFWPFDSPWRITRGPPGVIVRGWRRERHMMPPTTCGVRSSLSRTQTLIATRSPLWRLEGATDRPSTRTRNQNDSNWQTREIAQASIPLRVVGRSCGKFFSQNPDKNTQQKTNFGAEFHRISAPTKAC